MATQIVPFAEEHLDAAAALLAARHRVDRERAPELPVRFEDADETRGLLRKLVGEAGSSGVAALRDDRLVGYLLGAPDLVSPTAWFAQFVPPRATAIRYAGHAVDPAAGEAIDRDLYAALAARWLPAGLFAHSISLPAEDRRALDRWFALGFGQWIALAVRKTVPINGPVDPGVEFRRATADDEEAVLGLVEGLFRSFATPPISLPFPPEIVPDLRAHQRELLVDPANVHWLAVRDGRAVALQSFLTPESPAWFVPAPTTPERCLYLFEAYTVPEARGSGVGTGLLARTMAWARAEGYEQCALHFLTASRASSFWQGHGFRPLTFSLLRHVDERIAWADGRP